MIHAMRCLTTLSTLLIVCIVASCNEQAGNEKGNGLMETPVAETQAKDVASDTINTPRLVSASADGSLTLTAETGKGLGPNIKYMPEWRAFGWFTSSDSVQWDVNVATGGDYEVFMEWSVDDKEAGKQFLLRTDSEQLTGTVGKSGSWETFKTEKIGSIKLNSGNQRVVFKSNKSFSKDGALLDLRNLKLVKKD
jgi:Carbohydrate binding module (family 6)